MEIKAFPFQTLSGADMQQRKSSEAYLSQILLVKYNSMAQIR